MLDATFWDVSSASEPTDVAKDTCRHQITKAVEFFAQIADNDGARDRSGPLALLELEKRAVSHGLSTGMCFDVFQAYANSSRPKILTPFIRWLSPISSVSVTKLAVLRIWCLMFTFLATT